MQIMSERVSGATSVAATGWSRRDFAWGFVAMAPLWVGAIPVGIAYGVAARDVGLSVAEALLMSLTLFSAAAQLSAVSLFGEDAPAVVLVGTAVALNVHLLLIGLAVGRSARATRVMHVVTAYFLTDGAYGVVAARGGVTPARVTGAGVSMFVAWNIGTCLGVVAGGAIPDPRRVGVDFIAPLMFLAVLVPLLRNRAAVVAAAASGVVALALVWIAPGGSVVLGAGLAGSVAGAWWWGRAAGSGDGTDGSAGGTA